MSSAVPWFSIRTREISSGSVPVCLTFKVTSEQSGGVFMLTEDTMGRGKTTPLHVHPVHDETIYLIDGELIVHLDGVEHTAGPRLGRGDPARHAARLSGDLDVGPHPRVRHARGSQRRSILPRRRRGRSHAHRASAAGTPLNIARLVAAGKRTGFMDVLGPPPFKRDADAPREDAALA